MTLALCQTCNTSCYNLVLVTDLRAACILC